MNENVQSTTIGHAAQRSHPFIINFRQNEEGQNNKPKQNPYIGYNTFAEPALPLSMCIRVDGVYSVYAMRSPSCVLFFFFLFFFSLYALFIYDAIADITRWAWHVPATEKKTCSDWTKFVGGIWLIFSMI